MTDGFDRETLVRNWMGKANTALNDAMILNETGSQLGALNRLYYAAFYAVTAVLTRDGKHFSSHAGVLASFNRDYVKRAVFPKQTGRIFTRLFNERQKADYEPYIEVDKVAVAARVQQVKTLLELMHSYLKL